MIQNEWMNDPLVAGIDREKLEFLQLLVFEGQKLSKEQLVPFLMSVAQKGKSRNISFDDGEIDAIVTVLRKHSSPEEIEKINKLMSMKRKNRL
ncbi:MAG: hypothetical protein MR430_08630 [Lachnospiraceae bacterium]|nr:hypothetical protein [Lachnospiraceae bacterium]